MNSWRIFSIGTVVFVLVSLVASTVLGHGQFLMWLSGHRSPAADYYFYYVTKLGEEHGFVLIGVIFLFRYWRRSLMIAVMGLTVTVVTYLLKSFFQFERPSLFLNRMGWEGPLAVLDYPMLSGHSSFPSGHSMAAWALFAFVAALYRQTGVAVTCLFLAISVSISRVYLMAHFLRDVALGAAVGFAIGYLIYYIYDTKLKIK
jgi:membrane-associated phospholipid phosphatase